jgi:O-acetyl-ADP-ribose deacetylase (regulator of RNase III)
MPIELVKGDLFETPGIKAYAHGVDCAGEMAAGVAGQFKKRWPAMFAEYQALCAAKRLPLGDVFPWIGEDVTIYNLAIQRNWREKAKVAALSSSLQKMVALAAAAGITKVATPRLGAGLGGLEWLRVRRVLDEVGAETPVTIVVFEQFVRTRPAPPPT